jgi:hypothetical protein
MPREKALPDANGASALQLGRSWGLRCAVTGFIGVATLAVFRCVVENSTRAPIFDASVVAALCALALGALARAWERRQPPAFSLGIDGIVMFDARGGSRHLRITGCAQWSDILLALTLQPASGRPERLIVAADAVDPDTFRELSVRARRGAEAKL